MACIVSCRVVYGPQLPVIPPLAEMYCPVIHLLFSEHNSKMMSAMSPGCPARSSTRVMGVKNLSKKSIFSAPKMPVSV